MMAIMVAKITCTFKFHFLLGNYQSLFFINSGTVLSGEWAPTYLGLLKKLA